MDDITVDMQHEEEMIDNADGVSTLSQLKEIKETQTQIVDSMKGILDFITELPKMDYTVEEDGKKVTKSGPLWTLIKKAKKVGAF